MMKMGSRKLGVLVLLGILVIGVVLVGGWIKEKTATQTIKDISVKEAYEFDGKE